MTARPPKTLSSTTVSSRYQTVIPAEVREKFLIREGTKIAWIDKGDSLEVIPVPEAPWKQFRGSGRGLNYSSSLETYRKVERERARQENESRKREGEKPR